MITRKDFIKNLAVGAVAVHPSVRALVKLMDIDPAALDKMISFHFEFDRPADFLRLHFYFINCSRKNGYLLKGFEMPASYMIVRLPQLHVTEHLLTDCQFYIDPDDKSKGTFYDDGQTVHSYISSFSFLAFEIKFDSRGRMPFTQSSLLNWNRHRLLSTADLNPATALPVTVIHDRKPDISAYPVVKPCRSPFTNSAGIPISFFEIPYKMYMSPVALPGAAPASLFVFQGSNALRQINYAGGKRQVTELYNNLLFFKTSSANEGLENATKLKILGFATEKGIDGGLERDESLSGRYYFPFYANNTTCGANNDICFKEAVTSGLLLSGSDIGDPIPKQGGNQRRNLAQLGAINDGTDRLINADTFIFSALGAYTYLKYFNKDTAGYSIVCFKEKIVLGRDEYIEVVTEGYDHFGLKCYFVMIGKTTFYKGIRYNKYYVQIKYPDKSKKEYDISLQRNSVFSNDVEFVGRHIPLKSVSPATFSTPPLDPLADLIPLEAGGPTGNFIDSCRPDTSKSFYSYAILFNKKPLEMQYDGEDFNGNAVTIVKPLLFFDVDLWKNNATLALVNKKINTPDTLLINHMPVKLWRVAKFFNQKVAYVPLEGAPNFRKRNLGNDVDGHSSVKDAVNEIQTDTIDFFLNLADDGAKHSPCLPRLYEAIVTLPHLQGLIHDQVSIAVNYAGSYIDHGFEFAHNKAQVFVNLTDSTVSKLEGQLRDVRNLKALGGLITPDIPVKAVSILNKGVTLYENLNNVIDNGVDTISKINPKEILRGKLPELFKAIDLLEILEEFLPFDATPVFDVMQKFDEASDDAEGFFKTVGAQVKQKKQQIQQAIQQQTTAVQQLQQQYEQLVDATGAAVIQRFQTLQAEIKYADRMAAGIQDAAHGILKNEKTAANLLIDYYSGIITSDLNQAYDKAILALLPPATDAVVFLQNSKNTLIQFFTDQQTSIENTLTDNYNKLVQKLADYFVAGVAEIESLVVQHYADILNDLITIINTYNQIEQQIQTAIQAQRAVVAVLNAIPDVRINAFISTTIKAAEARVVLNVTTSLQQAVFGANTDRIYAGTNFFLKKLEEDYNHISDKTSAIAQNSKTVVASLQSRIKLFLNYYNGKAAALRLEAGQLAAQNPAITVAVKQKIDALTALSNSLLAPIGFSQALADYKALQSAIDQRQEMVTSAVNDVHQAIDVQISALKQKLAKAQTDLDQLSVSLKNAFTDFIADQETELIRQEQALLAAAGPDIAVIQGKIKDIQQLLQFLKNGNKIHRSYTWSTGNLRDADFGILQFKRHDHPATSFEITATADITLNYQQLPPTIQDYQFDSYNSVKNFSLVFLGILDIGLDEVSFTLSSKAKSKFNVKIGDVSFAGSLSFLQILQNAFSTVDKNLKLDIRSDYVELLYHLPFPDLIPPAGGFGYANLALNMGLRLPFDGSSLQFSFSVSDPVNKFRIQAGIYAGFGYFNLVAEPKAGIKLIEIALEFGAYAGISVGPLSGHVQLTAGLYFRRTDASVIIRGYIAFEGTASLWFISVTVYLYMGFESNGNYVEGQCIVSYSIKIAFFHKDFSASYVKRINGSGPPDNRSLADKKTAMFTTGNRSEAARPTLFKEYWESFF